MLDGCCASNKFRNYEKHKIFIFLVLYINFTNAQLESNTKEIEVCAKNKKKLFETEATVGFLSRDAPQLKVVVDNCKHYDPFVIGGIPALPKEYPPMARLGRFENNVTTWFCGGTLISEKFVLTAAHCFYATNAEVNRVRLGELDFSQTDDDSSPEDYTVAEIIEHPGYEPMSSIYNDIGLIKLEKSVKFDSYKHPACLPTTNGDDFEDFIATGWGFTKVAGFPSDQLMKVKLQRFENKDCQEKATRIPPEMLENGLNISTQICAGSRFSKDTCSGDSGGPLFAYHRQFPCMYYVIGVTSVGIESCGKPNVPAIYTRVFFYMNWIKSYIFA